MQQSIERVIGSIMTGADPRATKESAFRRQKTLLSKTMAPGSGQGKEELQGLLKKAQDTFSLDPIGLSKYRSEPTGPNAHYGSSNTASRS